MKFIGFIINENEIVFYIKKEYKKLRIDCTDGGIFISIYKNSKFLDFLDYFLLEEALNYLVGEV